MARNLEQKYTEAEYFFRTIEMASDEPASHNNTQNELDYFSWKVVKRRQKPQRRYTVSHGAPPAPPSTPTSLSKDHESLLSTFLTDSNNGNAAADDSDSDRFQMLYTLDYAPKFKKKLKEQERTAAELAELFKVVTITGGNGTGREPLTKATPEHGVSFASRRIRRELNVGSFKIHRNSNERTQELYDEDSLSAPEFTQSDDLVPRKRIGKPRHRTKRRPKLLVKHFELMEHMDEIADSFDAAMSFRPAQ